MLWWRGEDTFRGVIDVGVGGWGAEEQFTLWGEVKHVGEHGVGA